jgi:hypothetical protein
MNLTTGIITSIVVITALSCSETKKENSLLFERARYRPFADSVVIDVAMAGAKLDVQSNFRKSLFIRMLFLDYLQTDEFEGLSADSRDMIKVFLHHETSTEDVLNILKNQMEGVSEIKATNAVFLSEKIPVFSVIGGSSYFPEDVNGDIECQKQINSVITEFGKSL